MTVGVPAGCAALGDSHPRTKAAYSAMADFLQQLDVFLWAVKEYDNGKLLELARGNYDFNCKLLGVDPKAVPAAALHNVRRSEFGSVNFKSLQELPRQADAQCCYLDALNKKHAEAKTPAAKK